MAAVLAFPDDERSAYRRWWRGVVIAVHGEHGDTESVNQALEEVEPVAAARWRVYGNQASTCSVVREQDGPEIRQAVQEALQQLHELWTFRMMVLLGQMALDDVARRIGQRV